MTWAFPSLCRKLDSQEDMLRLFFNILDVECVVTGVPYLNDEDSVVLSDSPEVIFPVAALLVPGQRGLINGNWVIVFR